MVTAAGRPGASPVWNVPHERRTDFVGRRFLLQALGGRSPTRAGVVTQAVTGPGGVGKTRLAVEHAYSHRQDLDVVWWVRAEEIPTLQADLAGLGRELGLRAAGGVSVESTVREVRAWLADHDRWLVVADNAENAEAVHAVLPDCGRGQVLVTSRGDDWADVAEVVDVHALSEDEAAEFLLRGTDEAERGPALALARALGCLPLALEKAATYVARHPGIALRDYLEMYEARAAEPTTDEVAHPYPASVAITCALAVERVEKVSPVAVTLLRACAFLAPEAVPLSLIGGADELPEPLAAGPLAQRDALAALAAMGLARSTWPGGVAVDRVVQAVVRDDLGGDGRRTWVAGAVRLVERTFPTDADDPSQWGRCSCLVSHALAVTAHQEAVELEPQATSRLLARVGIYLQARAQFDEARRVLERALAIVEVTYGPDCLEAGIHLGNLAGVLQDMGEPAGARLCLERAVVIAEAGYGDNDPAMGTFIGNLGRVLADLGERARARLCFERALAIDELAYGPDHPVVASDLTNLALASWNDGDTFEAGRYFEQALVIDEEAYGPGDPTVARDLANLGLVLADMSDLVEARRHLERALVIVESAFGPDHPEMGPHLGNLAMVLQDCGQFARARTCLERALAIAEEHDGPVHPAVAAVLNNLAGVLSHLGETIEARRCFDRAVAIDEIALGPGHPEVGAIRDNRARLLADLDDLGSLD